MYFYKMRYFYITLFYLLLTLLCSSSFSDGPNSLKEEEKKQTVEFRIIEHLRSANLFEYSKWKAIESDYYRESSQVKRDKMVIKHYQSLYQSAIRSFSRKSQIHKSLEFTGITASILGTAIIPGLMQGPQMAAYCAINITSYCAMMWGFIETSPTSAGEHGPYSLLRNAIKLGKYARGKAIDDPYVEVEEVFAKAYFRLHKYHPQLYIKTKKLIKKMRDDSPEFIHNYMSYVSTAASLPLGDDLCTVNEYHMNTAFKNFSQQVVDSLNYLSSTFLYSNQHANLNFSEEYPFYFEGVPGSGKTYAANNLSRGLGIPMIPVALDGADYDAIVGKRFDPHQSKDIGRLLEALSTAHAKKTYSLNALLFIDEFDRLLNSDDYPSRQVLSFMLKTLDPKKKSFYSVYLGVEVKLPNLIILAGNFPIQDEALINRFETVKFDGFDSDHKMIILHESILPNALKSFGLKKDILKETDMEQLEELVNNKPDERGLRYIEKAVNKMLINKVGKKNLIRAINP